MCGATLLSKLLNQVHHAFKMDLSHVVAWSDSTIVLHWLDGNPRRFKTFVGNRVASILEFLPSATWKHVPTANNPADCASRGLLPLDLLHHSLWWEGPLWLHQELPDYPEQPLTPPPVLPEVEAVCHAAMPSPPQLWLEERYSSYHTSCSESQHGAKDLYTTSEQCQTVASAMSIYHRSENGRSILFTVSQQRWFANERMTLSAGKSLKPSRYLLCLNPTIESGGLLRVGGRLANAALSFAQQHPVILHGKDPLTPLFTWSLHISLLHAGPTLLMSSVGAVQPPLNTRRWVSFFSNKWQPVLHSTQQAWTLPDLLHSEKDTPGVLCS